MTLELNVIPFDSEHAVSPAILRTWNAKFQGSPSYIAEWKTSPTYAARLSEQTRNMILSWCKKNLQGNVAFFGSFALIIELPIDAALFRLRFSNEALPID